MAGIPKVKIQFDADFTGLQKGLSSAQTEVEGFGSKVGDFGKKAAVAFAAATVAAVAYAGKLLVDGVQSALADEAAQAKLSATLKNVTGATDAQVKATEAYILKTELATGKLDDELRPSLERLVRATKNVEEAQTLQTLALDIAAGTGKSLEQVTNALAKSYEGSNTALSKLGVGIDKAQLKTMSFDEVTASLAKTFDNQASIAADTYQGKLDRLSTGFTEAKETIGSALLPTLGQLTDFINKNILPVFIQFGDALSDKNSGISHYISTLVSVIKTVAIPIFDGMKNAFNDIKGAIMDNKDELMVFVNFIKNVVAPVIGTTLGTAFDIVGVAAKIVIGLVGDAVKVVNSLINAAITGLNAAITVINDISPFKDIPKIPHVAIGSTAASTSNFTFGSGNPSSTTSIPTKVTAPVVPDMPAMTSVQNASASAASVQTPITSSDIFAVLENAKNWLAETAPASNTSITVNGAIDPVGTARTIANLLGLEATASGTFLNLGVSRQVAV